MSSEDQYFRPNPLRLVALITTISVCLAVYDIVVAWKFSWTETVSTVVGVSFLVCFVQKRRVAWLIGVLIYICVPLLNVRKNLEFFTTAGSVKSWEVRVFALAL
jgi:nicotinamide riboside transporter PnuC